MYIFNIRKINIYIYICEIQITLFIHYRNVNIINFKFIIIINYAGNIQYQ